MSSSSFTNILIATDGSPTSRGAVNTGLELASAGKAAVTFVHVIPPVAWRDSRVGSYPVVTRLAAGADPVLAEAAAAAEDAGITPRLESVSGEATGTILALADQMDADLIVLGRGRNRRKMKSVRAAVLHRSRRPVLVARALDGRAA